MKCQCYANRKSVTISNWHAFLPTCPIYHYICRYDLGITPSDAKNQSHHRQKIKATLEMPKKYKHIQPTLPAVNIYVTPHRQTRQDSHNMQCRTDQPTNRPTNRETPTIPSRNQPSKPHRLFVDWYNKIHKTRNTRHVRYISQGGNAYIDTALPTTHSSVWKTIIHLH